MLYSDDQMNSGRPHPWFCAGCPVRWCLPPDRLFVGRHRTCGFLGWGPARQVRVPEGLNPAICIWFGHSAEGISLGVRIRILPPCKKPPAWGVVCLPCTCGFLKYVNLCRSVLRACWKHIQVFVPPSFHGTSRWHTPLMHQCLGCL